MSRICTYKSFVDLFEVFFDECFEVVADFGACFDAVFFHLPPEFFVESDAFDSSFVCHGMVGYLLVYKFTCSKVYKGVNIPTSKQCGVVGGRKGGNHHENPHKPLTVTNSTQPLLRVQTVLLAPTTQHLETTTNTLPELARRHGSHLQRVLPAIRRKRPGTTRAQRTRRDTHIRRPETPREMAEPLERAPLDNTARNAQRSGRHHPQKKQTAYRARLQDERASTNRAHRKLLHPPAQRLHTTLAKERVRNTRLRIPALLLPRQDSILTASAVHDTLDDSKGRHRTRGTGLQGSTPVLARARANERLSTLQEMIL